MGSKMMVSGLTHLVGRVKRSGLVQSGLDTSPNDVAWSMSSVPRECCSRDVPKTENGRKIMVPGSESSCRESEEARLGPEWMNTSRDIVGGIPRA